jgi:hypothetical protein
LIVDGAISVPEQPGLEIELDTDVLGQKLAPERNAPRSPAVTNRESIDVPAGADIHDTERLANH